MIEETEEDKELVFDQKLERALFLIFELEGHFAKWPELDRYCSEIHLFICTSEIKQSLWDCEKLRRKLKDE